MAERARCRNCGEMLTLWKTWSGDDKGYWRHEEPDTGLLLGEYCYWSPRADPMLP